MLDITTIILTYNEEKHIRRCLENVCSFSKKVYVVDSPSTDNTVEICKDFPNVEVVIHKYPGNQAEQLNWALENIDIQTKWTLRLDADEYLSAELIDEITKRLPELSSNVTGVVMPRWHYFMGKLMTFDKPAKILRLFRTGKATCEKRLMDEYMQLHEGGSIEFNNFFYDHTLSSVADYCNKHINYATREAVMQIDERYGLIKKNTENVEMGNAANCIRRKKAIYTKLPLFWRSFAFFLYLYIFRGACFGGSKTFIYVYMQAFWYRTLVDSLILEIENNCNKDVSKMKKYIELNFKIKL